MEIPKACTRRGVKWKRGKKTNYWKDIQIRFLKKKRGGGGSYHSRKGSEKPQKERRQLIQQGGFKRGWLKGVENWGRKRALMGEGLRRTRKKNHRRREKR